MRHADVLDIDLHHAVTGYPIELTLPLFLIPRILTLGMRPRYL